MDQFEVGPWRVEADPESTRQAYTVSDPLHCDCSHCTNFWAVRADVYPAEFLQLLDRLGVDSQAEDEVAEYSALPRALLSAVVVDDEDVTVGGADEPCGQ